MKQAPRPQENKASRA